MKNKLKSFIEKNKFIARVTDGWGYYKSDDAVWAKDILKFLRTHKEEKNEWIKIDKRHPLPKLEEVLAYNKEWVEADFNLKGVRIGYLTDEGNFISAKYEPDGEDYISKYEEGDDYQFSQTMENGTERTWYNNGDDRGDIEGYRPNLPTHYKRIDGLEED